MRIIVLLLGLLMSCAVNKPGIKRPYPFKASTKNQVLVDIYPWIFFDTLKVYSAQYLDDSLFKFKGKKFDSLQLCLFPEKFDFYYDEDQPIYACYKFKINDNNWGLITRVFSEYTSTKIQLFIYDRQKDSVYNYRDLAEDFGDGGDVFLQTSWLYLNKNKSIGCFTQEVNIHYHSVDDMNDTAVDRGLNYKYVQLLGEDTVKVIDEKLIRKFK